MCVHEARDTESEHVCACAVSCSGGRSAPHLAARVQRERKSNAGAAPCPDGERLHPRRPHAPGSVLWVGGMDASTSEAELIAAFAAWGLDAVHFPEGAAAAGRGFAFLTFSAPEEVRGLP